MFGKPLRFNTTTTGTDLHPSISTSTQRDWDTFLELQSRFASIPEDVGAESCPSWVCVCVCVCMRPFMSAGKATMTLKRHLLISHVVSAVLGDDVCG